MSLTLEWRHRIEAWRGELPRHFYQELGPVELHGFTTKAHFTATEALQAEYRSMPPNTPWGAKWEYGWFRGDFTLPEAARRERVVLCIETGGESIVWVNGRMAGARDEQHKAITLARSGVPGTCYEVLIESYAGHGPEVAHAGPTPPGRETVPEPEPAQAVVSCSTFGVWEEEVYQLWLDVETLWGVRESLDPESLRVAEIDQALRDFTLLVDFELDRDAFMETVRGGRERLKPLLACVNGSTAPVMFGFGHAHIDVAWLWPLAETERKCARTFSSQLALMEEYPEYKLLQSQAHLYRMVKERYPELYASIQRAVAAGQFIPEGGAWVEPDTNIAGGESLIRQFVHGKRFFRDEFGVECEMLWLPDVFGYSGALPQILRGCGIRTFSTQKIFWAYHGGDPFPYNTFVWEGIDGSEVLAHLHNDYNSRTDPATVIRRWQERVQKDGIATRLFPFGWGDGGGGPTRDHLEYARREADLEGVPRFKIATPGEFFRDQEARGWPQARYVGELYFQAHRGTYTSQAKTKKGNRKSELALREAELWGVAAQALAGWPYPAELLDETWKAVLLNQFHDILPGSSIHRVYEEAEAAHAQVIATANRVTGEATACLTDGALGLTAFNSLSWERSALAALPKSWVGAADAAGKPLPAQTMEGRAWVEVRVPACGWTTLRAAERYEPAAALSATATTLENEHLRLTIDERGELSSIYDKDAGRELAAGPCNSFRMYKDVPTWFDAWDIDSQYELQPVELAEPATVEVVATGPLVGTIRITRKLHQSTMTQEVSLRRGSQRVDFATVVDWQESHKLLKVAFPVTIRSDEAIHEIQFGHIRRPTHRSRPFDADRFEVCNHKWTALAEASRGCAVLNDCKYGVSVRGNSINLTLLKSALAPDMTADKGIQEFTYAFYAWNGSFAENAIVREAYELNCPVVTAEGAAGERSLFWVDAPNVIVETVKPAEDASPDVVVRLYEAKRTATRCTLGTSLPVRSAVQTDMLENTQQELECQGGHIPLDFRPFEVKTIRLRTSDTPALSQDQLWERIRALHVGGGVFNSLVKGKRYTITGLDEAAHECIIRYESGRELPILLEELHALYRELTTRGDLPRDFMRDPRNSLRIVGRRDWRQPGAAMYAILPRLDQRISVASGGHLLFRGRSGPD